MIGIFSKKKEKSELCSVREKIDKAYCLTSTVKMDFIAMGIKDVELQKNKWVELPNTVARKVRVMGLNINSDNYISVLVHYLPYGYIKPHFHEEMHETIEVLEGKVRNIVTGETYTEGDVIFIPKEDKHHIVGEEGGEVYMYVKFSPNKRNIRPIETEVRNWKKYKEA